MQLISHFSGGSHCQSRACSLVASCQLRMLLGRYLSTAHAPGELLSSRTFDTCSAGRKEDDRQSGQCGSIYGLIDRNGVWHMIYNLAKRRYFMPNVINQFIFLVDTITLAHQQYFCSPTKYNIQTYEQIITSK